MRNRVVHAMPSEPTPPSEVTPPRNTNRHPANEAASGTRRCHPSPAPLLPETVGGVALSTPIGIKVAIQLRTYRRVRVGNPGLSFA